MIFRIWWSSRPRLILCYDFSYCVNLFVTQLPGDHNLVMKNSYHLRKIKKNCIPWFLIRPCSKSKKGNKRETEKIQYHLSILYACQIPAFWFYQKYPHSTRLKFALKNFQASRRKCVWVCECVCVCVSMGVWGFMCTCVSE